MKSLSEFTGFQKRQSTKVDVNINDMLEEASSFTYSDVWSAFDNLKQITENYGLEMPDISTLENDIFGEEVFELDEDQYLYLFYSLNEEGTYDIVTGIFDEEELNEILSEDE